MFNGIFLGILTALSMAITFLKLPRPIKRFALKHELLTDILSGLSIWAVLGFISKTLVAVIGAVVGELLLGLALHLYKKRDYEKLFSRTRR